MLTPVPIPEGDDLLEFIGEAGLGSTELADVHVRHLTDLVHLYVRGQGFDTTAEQVHPALRSVILSAAARSYASPTNAKRVEIANYSEVFAAFEGWTLIERATLHEFRARTA